MLLNAFVHVFRENCRRKRAKELAQMKLIEKQFAHRHISKLKRKDGTTAAEPGTATNSE
jgi:hypothetical protein